MGGDIEITLAQMVAPEYGLSDCVTVVHEKMFAWAQLNDQLEDLQMGCYDPYCDTNVVGDSGYECFNSHEDEADGDEAEIRLMFDGAIGVSEHAQSGVLMPASFAVLAMIVLLLLIASRMKTNKGGESLLSGGETDVPYGTV